MHGESDLLSQIEILGCKLNYQQLSLVEDDFTIKNLFEDFQDGIRLCRAIQLLKSDASILSTVTAYTDSNKKKLQNCSIALQYLKQAGVPLSDEDGIQIEPEDIVNGDKELTLSLLWNMFVHLQELDGFKGCTELDLLLSWIEEHKARRKEKEEAKEKARGEEKAKEAEMHALENASSVADTSKVLGRLDALLDISYA